MMSYLHILEFKYNQNQTKVAGDQKMSVESYIWGLQNSFSVL